MFIRDNEDALNEINLKPVREIKSQGAFSVFDFIIFIVLMIPILMILFTLGISVWTGIGCGIYILVCAALIFIRIGKKKLALIVWRFIKRLFSKTKFTDKPDKSGANEVDAFWRISKIEDNKIFISDINKRVLSVFRIDGYDLSLTDKNGQNKVIESWTELFGSQISFKIICTGMRYKSISKEFKQIKTNSTIERLKKDYNAQIDKLNHDKQVKQPAYFLVLETSNVELANSQADYLADCLIDAKAKLIPASDDEICQILNKFWISGYFKLNKKIKNPINEINVYKNCIKLNCVEKNKDDKDKFNYIAIKTISLLPNIAEQGYLNDIFNNPEYTWLIDCESTSPEQAKYAMEQASNTIYSLISSNWFKKRAKDTERKAIEEIDNQIGDITDAIVKRSQNYSLRKCMFYCIIKGGSKKDLENKVKNFNTWMKQYHRFFRIEDNSWLQFDGFVKTRINKIESYENKGTKKNNKVKELDIIKDNQLHVLNTSLALGYIFSNSIQAATKSTWFQGFNVKPTNSSTIQPVFADYWSVNNQQNSFSRIYLAQTGKGKTWAVKKDLLHDFLDGNYIITIDPKEDYVESCKLLDGTNLNLGMETKNAPILNLFDVLITPNDTDKNNNEQNSNVLFKTFAKNNAVIMALLNLDAKEDKPIIAAWDLVQNYVYKRVCKFTDSTDFKKVDKKKMPIMDDFICACDKLKKKYPDYARSLGDLKQLLDRFGTNGAYGYLFNKYSNVDWKSNTLFNLNISAIASLDTCIFASYIAYIMYMAIDIMIGNKNSGKRFNLYIDEFHMIRDISCVLRTIAKFIKICRSHNGSLSIVDLGLGVVSGDADRLYKEIFEQVRYGFYFNASENDINKLAIMMDYSGNPLSPAERKYLSVARQGECLMVCNAYDRLRLRNDVSYWRWFFEQTKSEGKLNE
jgi:hypothetical protein